MRRSVIVALLLAGLACAAAAPAGARVRSHDVLFVANSSDGTVTLIDAHTFRRLGVLNAIPDGNTPQDPQQAAIYPAITGRQGVNYAQDMAISPRHDVVYVSRGYLGDVAALSLRTHKLLWRLQIDSLRADHVTLSPNGRRLFVSAITSDKVQVIDTSTHQFVGSFATGTWPHVLDFTPNHRYVVNGSLGNQLLPSGADGTHQLTFADPNTLQVARTIDFPAGVRPFVFSADGKRLYVQLSYFNGFYVYDVASGRLLHTVALPFSPEAKAMKQSDYPNQAAHHGIALSKDGRYICDAGTIDDYTALVDRRSLKVLRIIPVGDDPGWAITSRDGRYCFVTSRGPKANTVSVISYAKRRVIRRVKTGLHPQFELEARVADSVLRAGGYLKSR